MDTKIIFSILEILGLIFGLIYIYYQYKASYKLWIYGLIMSICYILVFLHAEVYYWATLNLYNLIIQVFSIWNLKKGGQDTTPLGERVSPIPVKYYPLVILAIAILSLPLSYIAIHYLNSPIPVPEAISTAISIVAMVILARYYIEHWILWIIVDIFYTVYNITLGLYFTSFLYLVYTIVAIMGYIKWRKLARKKVE